MKIDSIIPNSGLPNTPLLIKGDGLENADKLNFGGESVPFKVSSTGSIETSAPSGSGTVDVVAELADGDKSNSVSFTFLEVH